MGDSNPIRRLHRRPTHLNAIKAMCAHCVGCTETHLERGFRDSIRDCTAWGCPLHRYRPFRPKIGAENLPSVGLELDSRGRLRAVR